MVVVLMLTIVETLGTLASSQRSHDLSVELRLETSFLMLLERSKPPLFFSSLKKMYHISWVNIYIFDIVFNQLGLVLMDQGINKL